MDGEAVAVVDLEEGMEIEYKTAHGGRAVGIVEAQWRVGGYVRTQLCDGVVLTHAPFRSIVVLS